MARDIPNVAINGFGRIGRLVTRAFLEHKLPVNIVAINDLSSPDMLAHLFEFDSVHGRFNGSVEVHNETNNLIFDGDEFTVLSEKDPSKLPWKEMEVDYVIESTGFFRTRELMSKHLEAGAKRVVLSAPGKGVDATIVLGVNQQIYDPKQHYLISNASCTTNCLATVCKVLDDEFGIEHGTMSTVHSYTNDQRLLDSQHKDFRRSRSAAMSIVPTTTGAAKTIGVIMPHLEGKMDGISIRVPTPNVSLVDLTVRLKKDAESKDHVQKVFEDAAHGYMKGILDYEWRSLVSVDFNTNPHSAIIDFPSMMLVENTLLKVLAWYDNEWGYASRTAELVDFLWKNEP